MPFHCPELSRRQFLASTIAGGVLSLRPSRAFAADADPHRLALVSDTHIPAKPTTRGRNNADMTSQLRRVVEDIRVLSPRPGLAIVNGDLAHDIGTPGDYQAFADLMRPLRDDGMPLHLAMGNHDNHVGFEKGMTPKSANQQPVTGKLVSVIELPRANLFVLDSLDIGMPKLTGPGGRLGALQLKWLAAALDQRTSKPAIVFGHHNLQATANKDGSWTGLADSESLWADLKKRPQVKAYVFGHTHTWKLDQRDGLHLINLPATSYGFDQNTFLGWLDGRLESRGIKLVTHGLNYAHPVHNKTFELTWRA